MKYTMKKNKMMLLAAACSILLLGSCGTSKNVQALAPHQPVIRKRMPPRVLALVRVRRSESWLRTESFRQSGVYQEYCRQHVVYSSGW